MSKDFNGVAGLVRLALFLDDQLGMEIVEIGRGGLDPQDSCTLVATSKWLAYHLVLDGGWLWLKVQLLDKGDPPELLANFPDGPEGFKTVACIIRAFERDQIKSLEKPIELGGGSGPNGWVIS